VGKKQKSGNLQQISAKPFSSRIRMSEFTGTAASTQRAKTFSTKALMHASLSNQGNRLMTPTFWLTSVGNNFTGADVEELRLPFMSVSDGLDGTPSDRK